uniref:Family with sequence similarity 83 member G n=1 Tax=Buteo japonicus TaxID=224669 RepID=A0A8C0ASF3_9AVES
MAFSQVQCLDDSHVNWRSSESKPEFFYSEEQRLALEALASRGPDAFYEVLKKENIRDFLSELELKKILDTLETYDPGSEYIPRHGSGAGESEGDRNSQGDEQDVAPSLEYWPQRSDRSIPQLDLGWPETIAYRGVTRATVYMQPPIEGQAHIKEVVRKMICQAQKVIAVVMDMFTDVDIFKDLLDAGFKRKVGVYIILDETNVKHFLQMCERAQMHNLRVRSTGGTEFFTRSATKFKGALAQKFMFVDGDRAMCGSYSFTWSAARTDRNVITVLSGQVVEAFDKQFQELYLMSKGVSLKSISMGEEPEPEPVTLPSVVPVTPANAVVKKLINPKYALVKAKSTPQTPMEAPAAPATSPIEGTSWTTKQAGTFAASPLGHRLKPPEETLEDIKPPVPKPRTIPLGVLMTKVITPCDSGTAPEASTETCHLQPDRLVAGPQEDKGPPCAHNGLGEEEEEEEEEYITLSDQESYSSSSADHSYRRSNASSISDEYLEVRDRYGPLRRTNSDVTHNGEILPMQRKLSDPHISRGTFLSPLGSLPSLKHVRVEDMMKRRSNAVEIRCVLPRTILDGNSSYPSSAAQVGLFAITFPIFLHPTKVANLEVTQPAQPRRGVIPSFGVAS